MCEKDSENMKSQPPVSEDQTYEADAALAVMELEALIERRDMESMGVPKHLARGHE